jgi:hypothetical protein
LPVDVVRADHQGDDVRLVAVELEGMMGEMPVVPRDGSLLIV